MMDSHALPTAKCSVTARRWRWVPQRKLTSATIGALAPACPPLLFLLSSWQHITMQPVTLYICDTPHLTLTGCECSQTFCRLVAGGCSWRHSNWMWFFDKNCIACTTEKELWPNAGNMGNAGNADNMGNSLIIHVTSIIPMLTASPSFYHDAGATSITNVTGITLNFLPVLQALLTPPSLATLPLTISHLSHSPLLAHHLSLYRIIPHYGPHCQHYSPYQH